jgi:hypothetical protein
MKEISEFTIDDIRELLDQGYYESAGYIALFMSLFTTSESALVHVLATAFMELGDHGNPPRRPMPEKTRGSARPGRPSKAGSYLQLCHEAHARSVYEMAVLSRRLVDDRDPSLSSAEVRRLATFFDGCRWESGVFGSSIARAADQLSSSNEKEVTDAVRRIAATFLKDLKLSPTKIERRGFRSETKRRIASRFGVAQSVLIKPKNN